MNVETSARISIKLQSAIYRESLALVETGIADAADVDRVVTNSIGRRWSVGGPFEIWEQIGWDLVQVIAGELFADISVATSVSEISVPEVSESPSVASGGSSAESKFQIVAVIGAGVVGSAFLDQLLAMKSTITYNLVLLAEAERSLISKDFLLNIVY